MSDMIGPIPLRADQAVIATLVDDGARVLDVGCGDGTLLAWLKDHKRVDARGLEIDAQQVQRAIARGLSVIHGDADTDLPDYGNDSYHCIILSQTLQTARDPKALLMQLMRIAPRMVVSVPNFGHWKNRFYLALKGRMPVTQTLTYEWYDTPNIHFCTIRDFIILCESLGLKIEKRIMVDAQGRRSRFYGRGFWANLFGEQGVFLLRRI